MIPTKAEVKLRRNVGGYIYGKPIFALGAALLAAGFISAPAVADPVSLQDTLPHITTTGSALIEVVPDLADVHLGVGNERPTAKEATEATAKAAADIIAAVKAHGIEPRDIKTNFDLAAQYDQVQKPIGAITGRKLRGYLAHEDIVVRVHDIDKASALAREFIDSGANAFAGVTFFYSKEREKRRDLDALAMRDALAKAKSYTDALGLKLGRVLQIGNEQSDRDIGVDLPSRRAPPVYSTNPVAIPVEPGVQRLEQSVSVIWEIEGKAP